MDKFIFHKNSKVAYTDIGKGNTIVLLHGFLENATMWHKITSSLSSKNRVICIDLLGHGNTECIGYIHTMSDMAEAVKAVLKTLNISSFYIIGHSMGGYVSLAIAEKYPKKIKGICLLNSSAQSDSEERKKLRLRASKMAQTNYKSLVKMSISNLFTAETSTQFTTEIAEIKKQALQTLVQGYIAATEGMRLRENKEAVLQNVDKRLIIVGKNDSILNYHTIIEEANRTKTPFYELSGGHMSHIENKDELLKMLHKFIEN
ncbi:alpha/beta fold hydrolase [Tenacibaculum salmonis]|uniref:alpha/beta fold hydrolase n=1 Tax=Tenacibaculum sp. P3-BQ1 TaxID=3232310 RepID=UPI0034DEE1E0